MTIAQLSVRNASEKGQRQELLRERLSVWRGEAEHEQIAFLNFRKRSLERHEADMATPQATAATAFRQASLARSAAEAQAVMDTWISEHSMPVPTFLQADAGKFAFFVVGIRGLQLERQRRLVRRLADVAEHFSPDALKHASLEDIRAGLLEGGFKTRRVRDAVFAVRVYRDAVALSGVSAEPQELTMVSLFDGIGAASVAAANLNRRIRVIATADIAPFPSAVTAYRHPGVPNLKDVSRINWDDYKGKVDIVAAGFPCQDISRAGNGAGLDGARSNLFFEFVRAARELQPKFVIIENVEALLQADKRKDLVRLVKACLDAGYKLDIDLLNAEAFGLPLYRPRFYAVGVRVDLAARLPQRRAWWHHDLTRSVSKVTFPEDRRLMERIGIRVDDKHMKVRAVLSDVRKRMRVPGLFLRGLLTGYRVHQSAFLGDFLDRDFDPSLVIDDKRSNAVRKWKLMGFDPDEMPERASFAAEFPRGHLERMRRRIAGRSVVVGHGVARNLCTTGGTHGLNGGGVRAHSSYTFTCRDGFACLQEGIPRLLSHEEKEILMGFPRGYTAIKLRGRPASNSQRNKALGNSMAVPCIAWALESILVADLLLRLA